MLVVGQAGNASPGSATARPAGALNVAGLPRSGAISLDATFGAHLDGSADDQPAFMSFYAYRLSHATTGYGYSKGLPRGRIPPAVLYMGSPLDIYGSGILEGDCGSVFGGSNSVLKFAPNITGMRIQFAATGGENIYDTRIADPSASGSIIRQIALQGQNTGSDASHPGIRIKAPVAIEDVFIDGFAGNGIHSNAQLSKPGRSPNSSSAYGNASLSQIYRCTAQKCLDGYHMQGADSSIFLVMGSSANDNRGYGFVDASEFGGVFLACHAANNALGGYHTDPAQSAAHPLLVGCYDETGQPAPTFGPGTLRVGGSWNPGATGGGYVYAAADRVHVNALCCDDTMIINGNTNIGHQSGAAADTTITFDTTNTTRLTFARYKADGSLAAADGYIWNLFGETIINGRSGIRLRFNGADIAYAVAGGLDLRPGMVLSINGDRVVGARGGRIPPLDVVSRAGALPRADGRVTIANAASPTNRELLEYCRELEAKLESLLGSLRASTGHGLIA